MRLSLIIPAYNEEQRLNSFLQSVVNYAVRNPEELYEVIVIDDGSTDNTARLVQRYAERLPRLRLLRHQHNRGKGAAVQTGVMAAEGEYIVFMDADGATAITELPKMIRVLGEAHIGIGNRWMKGAVTYRNSLLRRFAGWIYRRYMGLFGLGRIDTMCGFKGYRRDVARKLFSNLIEERWLFDTEVAYKAVQAGYTSKNFPITWESKDGSKLNLLTLLKSALHIGPLIRKIKRSAYPSGSLKGAGRVQELDKLHK